MVLEKSKQMKSLERSCGAAQVYVHPQLQSGQTGRTGKAQLSSWISLPNSKAELRLQDIVNQLKLSFAWKPCKVFNA